MRYLCIDSIFWTYSQHFTSPLYASIPRCDIVSAVEMMCTAYCAENTGRICFSADPVYSGILCYLHVKTSACFFKPGAHWLPVYVLTCPLQRNLHCIFPPRMSHRGQLNSSYFFFLARCEELSRDCRRDWQRFYAPFHSAPNLFIQTVLDSWPMFGGHELGLEWLEIWWSFVGRGGFSCKSRENTAPNTHTRRLHISTQE